MLFSSKNLARSARRKILIIFAHFCNLKLISMTEKDQNFLGLLFLKLSDWIFLVQFPVRFEKFWQLDLFLSTKSYVQVHNLHINGGGGLNFWLTLMSLMYVYITWGWVGLNFRPTLMYPKRHVFHQLMYGPPHLTTFNSI